MSDINGMYGRTEPDGSISVWSMSTGAAVTFMPADVHPVGSKLTARKNHPLGIRLTRKDALAIGLEIRGAAPGSAKATPGKPAKAPVAAMPSPPPFSPFRPFGKTEPTPLERRTNSPPNRPTR